jgi:four helix bundle protein
MSDPLWQTICYRLAMYLYDLAWRDCVALKQDFRGNQIVSQLIRSTGGICANIEEAYGRGLGTADNVRIMRIALGEARETQGWYFRSRHILPRELIERRIDVVDQVIRLLVNSISRGRKAIASR